MNAFAIQFFSQYLFPNSPSYNINTERYRCLLQVTMITELLPNNPSSLKTSKNIQDRIQYAQILSFFAYLKEIGRIDQEMIEASYFQNTAYDPIIPSPYDWNTWANLDWVNSGADSLALYLEKGNLPDGNYLGYFISQVLIPYVTKALENRIISSPIEAGSIPDQSVILEVINELENKKKQNLRRLAYSELLIMLSSRFIENVINNENGKFHFNFELSFASETIGADFIDAYIFVEKGLMKIGDSREVDTAPTLIDSAGDQLIALKNLLIRKSIVRISAENNDLGIPRDLLSESTSFHFLPILRQEDPVGLLRIANGPSDPETMVVMKIIMNMIETSLDSRQVRVVLAKKNRELNSIVGSLRKYNHCLRLFSSGSEMLFKCQDEDEFFQTAASLINDIFPNKMGGIYLLDADMLPNQLVVSWNNYTPDQNVADRLSIPLSLNIPAVNDDSSIWYFVPMISNGMKVGLLVLEKTFYSPSTSPDVIEAMEALPYLIADKIGSALLSLREFHNQKYIDPLTGVYNRAYFERIKHQSTPTSQGVLVIIDLDRFKEINDTYGHLAGDFILSEVGRIFSHFFRASDIICRIGGDEFLVWMGGATISNVQEKIEELCCRISKHDFVFQGQNIRITISTGMVETTTERTTIASLFATADCALYEAKHQGKNRVCIGDTSHLE
mgnify:CR=1 FL=1